MDVQLKNGVLQAIPYEKNGHVGILIQFTDLNGNTKNITSVTSNGDDVSKFTTMTIGKSILPGLNEVPACHGVITDIGKISA